MTNHRIVRSQAQPTAAHADQRERAARLRDASGRFAKNVEQAAREVEKPEQPAVPTGTIPAPADAPDDAYALSVNDDSLGLHAAPGSSLVVAPVMPTGAGLAAFYLKGRTGAVIFDLTHGFRPEYARPFAPGSEAVPLIEVVVPGTGQMGGLRADQVEKIHNVLGVYTPADIAMKHRIAPPRLPVMSACPEGMGEQYVDDAVAYPLVRKGETVIFDPSRREPTHGALCVLQWNNGRRDVMLTNQRTVGDLEEKWWVDPVNRPANREAGPLYASDGPYDEAHLREKIVGTVVGVLVRGSQPTEPEAAEPDTSVFAKGDAIRAKAAQERDAALSIALDDAGLTSLASAEVRAAIEGHRNVMVATECRGDEDDETFHHEAQMQIDAEYAVAHAPVRSMADLRAKLTYLLPIMAPNMLDRTHVEHLIALRDDVDLLCQRPHAPAAAADPIFAAIEECRRLEAAHAAIHDICAGMPDDDPSWDGQPEAHAAYWSYWRKVVLRTVPRTAEGCRALAAYAGQFFETQGGSDKDAETVLALITRSPMLPGFAPASDLAKGA